MSGKFGDLRARLLTALVAIPLILGLLLHAPPLWTVGAVGVALVIGLFEFYALWDPLESTCRHASLSIL